MFILFWRVQQVCNALYAAFYSSSKEQTGWNSTPRDSLVCALSFADVSTNISTSKPHSAVWKLWCSRMLLMALREMLGRHEQGIQIESVNLRLCPVALLSRWSAHTSMIWPAGSHGTQHRRPTKLYVVDNLLRKANFEASSSSRGRPEAEGRVRFRV